MGLPCVVQSVETIWNPILLQPFLPSARVMMSRLALCALLWLAALLGPGTLVASQPGVNRPLPLVTTSLSELTLAAAVLLLDAAGDSPSPLA